jgi:hypothetical protein
MTDLDAALDELYRLPPSEFVAARNALAKELRAEKRRDEAQTVTARRRPSPAAWALNQLVLGGGDAFGPVGAAVGAVREPPGGDLRGAMGDLRDAIGQAAEIAAERSGLGVGDLAAALQAVVSDDEALTALTSGRLTEVPTAGASGFGMAVAAGGPSPKRGRAAPSSGRQKTEPTGEDESAGAARHRLAREARAAARAERQAAREARAAADEALARVRSRLEEAEAAYHAAEERHRAARAAVEEALAVQAAAVEKEKEAEAAASAAEEAAGD